MPTHSTIQVQFIDANTGQSLGETEMPADKLPPSFDDVAALQIDDKPYEVVSAEPRTAAEYRQTGTVRLMLRAKSLPTAVNPRDILFSLPTLCDALPALDEGSTKQGLNVLELHEDDWRQIEFVALTLESSVETDLRAVAQIHKKHFKDSGFDAIHVRKAVASPLEGTWLTLDDLRSTLGPAATWFDGLAFQGATGLIAGGFAVKLASGLTLYGTQRGGRISVLALRSRDGTTDVEGDARLLASIASRSQLLLIDWCRVEQLPPVAQHIRDWLSGR
ncbi:hypothetical protein JRI60_32545 [Archangium violaceum]|uniref:hypothetical protein n=1 Tax=Archangium violaceum TaxID=83451 RepID=UPI00195089B0|nr:hypothetical protein [Archangium violaceum]QRN93872.1 hypothetical protein JRI60_32545 [Archangium violaceum]